MSRFKSCLISTLFTAIYALGFVMPVLGPTDERVGNPVGGVVTAVNKLAIIAPYIALAGLIIAISAIIIKKTK